MFPVRDAEAPARSGTPNPQSRAVTEAAAPAGLAGQKESDRVAPGGSEPESGRGQAGGESSVMLLDVASEAGMDLPEERVPSRPPARVHHSGGGLIKDAVAPRAEPRQ